MAAEDPSGFLESVSSAYERGYEAYTRSWLAPHPWLAKEREEFARRVQVNMSLIDVGCGPGHDCKFWSDHGLRVVGVDNCPGMINTAKQNYPELQFRGGDILKMSKADFSEAPFDCAWLAYIMLHLCPKSLPVAFANILDLLKPGGLVFVATSLARTSGPKIGTIAGLKDNTGADILAPTYEWSLDDWNKVVHTSLLEQWSRVSDFMGGKATILTAIYSAKSKLTT